MITLKKLLTIIELDEQFFDLVYVDGEFFANDAFLNDLSEHLEYIVSKLKITEGAPYSEHSDSEKILYLKSK